MVKLYYLPASPPCRAVMLTARALGVDLELEKVDLFQGQHKSPEFLQVNIQHTIPVIDDNGFILSESRAIMCYLADKYAKEDDDSLYPKDVQQRAMVHQRLFFDIGTLTHRYLNYFYPAVFTGADFEESKLAPLEEAFSFLDKYLEDSPWVAGENQTIADYSILPIVNCVQLLGFDVSKFSNVSRWFEDARGGIDGFDEIEQTGADMFKTTLDSLAAARGRD